MHTICTDRGQLGRRQEPEAAHRRPDTEGERRQRREHETRRGRRGTVD